MPWTPLLAITGAEPTESLARLYPALNGDPNPGQVLSQAT